MRISDWSSDVCSSDLTPGIAGQAYIEGRTDQSLRMDVTHMKSAASQANRPRACELETSVARLKKRMAGIHGRQRLAVGFDSVPDALAHSIQDRLGPIEERPARLRSAAQRLTDRVGPRAVQGAQGDRKSTRLNSSH